MVFWIKLKILEDFNKEILKHKGNENFEILNDSMSKDCLEIHEKLKFEFIILIDDFHAN